jgi:hypothetical protein
MAFFFQAELLDSLFFYFSKTVRNEVDGGIVDG